MASVLREDSSGLGNLEAQIEEQVASASTGASGSRSGFGEQGIATNDHAAPPSEGSEYDDGLDMEKSVNSSVSHWDPDPGFAHVDGDIEGHGYNKTTVDIVAVPCIGASPVDTWSRDPIGDGYFSFPSNELDRYPTAMQLPGNSVLSPTITHNLPAATHLWVRQGIRKEINTARVMLYRHRELTEGITLDQAADDLLEQVVKMRAGLTKARPIFFICHSIGGLVAKLALVKANMKHELRPLIFDCHGIAFFATPHRGSSYMSMPHLRESIQHLLYLQKPLPRSIARELRIGNKSLLQMHDQFMDIASELRIWTFYETIDSQLSGLGSSDFDEVHFSAPLTSIKSGLVGSRAEQALSLESDHAHCASFGPQNIRTMLSFITDLGAAIRKAEELSNKYVHTPLRLSETVKLEIIGFYGDPDSESSQDIRLYISKHRLKDFLEKGPEQCLQERLNTVAARRHRMAPPSRRPLSNPSPMASALGILGNVQELGQKLLGSVRPSSLPPEGPETETPAGQPEIVVTSHASRPSATSAATEPAVSSRRGRGLIVPGLSTPSRGSSETVRTTKSEPDEIEISHKMGYPAQQLKPSMTEPSGSAASAKEHDTDMKNRRGRSRGIQDFTAGFSRPVASRRKFMWIHMPFNNPHWITKIFNKLSETQNQNYLKLLGNENWANKHVQGRHANLHASYIKPGCAFVPSGVGSPRPPSPSRAGRSPSPGISPTYLYLYLPYLHYDTYLNIVRRRNLIKRRMEHGRARPVPKDIAELDSIDSRVIWEYIGHDPPLNTRRTLDQYGYPSLRETYARDDEQMLYKLTKEKLPIPFMRKWDVYHSEDSKGPLSALSPSSRLASATKMFKSQETASQKGEGDANLEDNLLDGNVLMVDQLWLWAVDTTTLMTFFPKRESQPTEGPMFQQADLRNSVYNELNGDLSGRCENALDLAAFVTLHAVTVLIDRTSHPNLEIFRIFEEALGILTERMTLSLKRFRMQTFRDRVQDSDSEPEDIGTESIKQRHKRELERAERDNREHTSVLLELRDMDDELTTMKNLFSEQEETVKLMKKQYEKPELLGYTENGRGFLEEALRRLQDYHKTVHEMIQRVDGTKKDYEKLQEMVQRQAQVDEARWSRRQTELASSQNLSVMIFTTFTVLFLPLSFFTSLFGMNTKEWGGEDDNFVSLGVIGLVSLPASALLIGGTLIAAYSSRVQTVVKESYKFTKSGVQGMVSQLTHIGTEDPRRKEIQNKLEQETLESRTRERGFDFWENVRLEKHREYKIPDMNRKQLTRQRAKY
ncbi:uncharacterized protein GGS22DRAFT_36216 [Annulohypoxylon maeteangense]|uniref:uncharacterized protein n=1 Tax=Annulohypoxylon maeteangense TaxID=1927788 RepID=UPI0020086BAA|nr:uncharacterized protein GGS22DRAFT_36216 [Annulohypoxylon maeteangense]KAI0883125.1 hypothetical protein GGS22DRAFT_36216 [Annulohypoxylon maeteangense]